MPTIQPSPLGVTTTPLGYGILPVFPGIVTVALLDPMLVGPADVVQPTLLQAAGGVLDPLAVPVYTVVPVDIIGVTTGLVGAPRSNVGVPRITLKRVAVRWPLTVLSVVDGAAG